MDPRDPLVWGPSAWRLLHMWSRMNAVAPQGFWRILRTFQRGIPCDACRGHFAEVLRTPGLSKGDPVRLVWELHNLVNRRIGKPVRSEAILARRKPMTVAQVRTDFRILYQSMAARFGDAKTAALWDRMHTRR